MAAVKVHYVKAKDLRKRVPLPPLCGNMKATAVTCDEERVTCEVCKEKLDADNDRSEQRPRRK